MKRTDNRNLSSKGALIWSLWPQVVRRAVEPLFSLGRYINRSKKAIFMFGVTILTVFTKLRKKGAPNFSTGSKEKAQQKSSFASCQSVSLSNSLCVRPNTERQNVHNYDARL